MELGLIFTTSFMVGLSGAMMPGPLLTVTIGESARRGFIAGPLIVLGHGILELILIVALVAGLSVYLTNAAVFSWIAVIGGAFLIYMGCGMIKDVLKGRLLLPLTAEAAVDPDIPVSPPADRGKTSSLYPVITGFFTSIANPYFTIWWATIGISYVTFSLKNGTIGLASFFSGHIMADLLWYSLVAAAIAGGRKFLSDKIYQIILMICGVFLVGLGLYFLYVGIM